MAVTKRVADGAPGARMVPGRPSDLRGGCPAGAQAVLPGAKSVIVLAMNYWQGPPAERVLFRSRWWRAWPDCPVRAGRRNYHESLERKLDELDAFLTERGGLQKRYVDTGPILERDFAALAGVGWQGKSTMLISPKLGGWFFLAELLTTLDLDADPPQPHRCGSCVRCITACPTGAIVAPYQLDARRCISYLTIELKGSIPVELRPLIGDRIYGCDDCTAACPWNRFAAASTEATFAAREYVHGMLLRDFLALDNDSFRALFRRSPIKRIKRRGLLRNVCVALGNIGTADDVPALRRAMNDHEPLVAEHAAWAIEQIESRINASGAVAATAC